MTRKIYGYTVIVARPYSVYKTLRLANAGKKIRKHFGVTLLTLCGVTCVLPCMQVADSASAVFGGAAFDLLHLNARQVSSIMLGVTLAPTTVWTGYAWWQCKLMSQEAQKGGAENGADAAAI